MLLLHGRLRAADPTTHCLSATGNMVPAGVVSLAIPAPPGPHFRYGKWTVATHPVRKTWSVALSERADVVAQINQALRYNMTDGVFSLVLCERLLYIGAESGS